MNWINTLVLIWISGQIVMAYQIGSAIMTLGGTQELYAALRGRDKKYQEVTDTQIAISLTCVVALGPVILLVLMMRSKE